MSEDYLADKMATIQQSWEQAVADAFDAAQQGLWNRELSKREEFLAKHLRITVPWLAFERDEDSHERIVRFTHRTFAWHPKNYQWVMPPMETIGLAFTGIESARPPHNSRMTGIAD